MDPAEDLSGRCDLLTAMGPGDAKEAAKRELCGRIAAYRESDAFEFDDEDELHWLGEVETAAAKGGQQVADLYAHARQTPALLWQDVASIFRPLPPIPYVCEHIDLCPGAPMLAAGYGFSGKTVALQSLALSIAAGRLAWGAFDVTAGAVVHLDYEQGFRLTAERYQRLARGLGIEPTALSDRLRLVSMPPLYLDAPTAPNVLCRALGGCTVAIVDSLRAAAPSVDENSSEARRVLDMLGRVSEQTGCAAIVIHHARKPSKDAAGGTRMTIRGSGAIYDACSSVLVFDGAKGQPTTVSHEKARTSGQTAESFDLAIADVSDGFDDRWGLRVAVTQREARQLSTDDVRVLEAVRATPGASSRQIQAYLACSGGRGRTVVADALHRLERDGHIRQILGARRALHWWPAEQEPPARQLAPEDDPDAIANTMARNLGGGT